MKEDNYVVQGDVNQKHQLQDCNDCTKDNNAEFAEHVNTVVSNAEIPMSTRRSHPTALVSLNVHENITMRGICNAAGCECIVNSIRWFNVNCNSVISGNGFSVHLRKNARMLVRRFCVRSIPQRVGCEAGHNPVGAG